MMMVTLVEWFHQTVSKEKLWYESLSTTAILGWKESVIWNHLLETSDNLKPVS